MPNTCATKASENIKSRPSYSLDGIRQIEQTSLDISKQCIGRGVFAKCFIGKLAHIEVCVKVFMNTLFLQKHISYCNAIITTCHGYMEL